MTNPEWNLPKEGAHIWDIDGWRQRAGLVEFLVLLKQFVLW